MAWVCLSIFQKLCGQSVSQNSCCVSSVGHQAFSRTITRHAAAKELFSIVKDLDNYFGHSDGQTLYRSVGVELGTGLTHLARVGGARKAGALSQLATKLIRSFKQVSVSLTARAEWRKTKHGRIILESIAETSRRVHDLSFIVFLVVCHSIMQPIRQHILFVQANVEPWAVKEADGELMSSLDSIHFAIEEVQKLACVCCLLAQHLSVKERGRALPFAF